MRTLAGSLARLVVEWIVQVAVGVAGTYGVVAEVLGMLQRKLIFTRPSRVKRAELGAAEERIWFGSRLSKHVMVPSWR